MPPHQIIPINTIFAPPFSSFALRWLAGFSDRISNLPLHQKSSHRQSLQTPPTSQQPTPCRMRHALCARRLVPGAKKMEDFRLQALCWAPWTVVCCRVRRPCSAPQGKPIWVLRPKPLLHHTGPHLCSLGPTCSLFCTAADQSVYSQENNSTLYLILRPCLGTCFASEGE